MNTPTIEAPRIFTEGNQPDLESEESEAEGTAGIEEEVANPSDPDGPGDPDDVGDLDAKGLGAIAGQLTDLDREMMSRDTEAPRPGETIKWSAVDGEPTQVLVSKPRKRGRPPGSKSRSISVGHLSTCGMSAAKGNETWDSITGRCDECDSIIRTTKETSNVQTQEATQAAQKTNGHATHETEAIMADDYAERFKAAQAVQAKADEMHRDLIEAARVNVQYKKDALAKAEAELTSLEELIGLKPGAATAPKRRGRPPGPSVKKAKALASPKPAKKVSKARKPAKDVAPIDVKAVLNAIKHAGKDGIAKSAIVSATKLDAGDVTKAITAILDAKDAKMVGKNRGARYLST